MSMTTAYTLNFQGEIIALLPELRRYARSLTRDNDRADDLVQDTVLKALAGEKTFHRNTNFPAWMMRIQRNAFISGIRRERPTVAFDETFHDGHSSPPRQLDGLKRRDFLRAFGQLSGGQREALTLSALDGMRYEEIARRGGVSIGTIKSRICRARNRLEQLLGVDDSIMVPTPLVQASIVRDDSRINARP